jgi:hypothetical protein
MNQSFSYYFCLLIEGSGSGAGCETLLTSKHSFNLHFFALHMDPVQKFVEKSLA